MGFARDSTSTSAVDIMEDDVSFPLLFLGTRYFVWSWEGGRSLIKSLTIASMKNPKSCPQSLVVGG